MIAREVDAVVRDSRKERLALGDALLLHDPLVRVLDRVAHRAHSLVHGLEGLELIGRRDRRECRCAKEALVVAFHGKEAAKAVSRFLGYGRKVSLGLQPWRIGDSRTFVVPSASGANRNANRLEGKPSRVAWFMELCELIERVVR
jgi:hypothetical protein